MRCVISACLALALDAGDRDRFRDISVELSALSNAFGSAVLDATESWSEHVTDAALLDGVSDADRTMFCRRREGQGLDGWLVTLQQPSVNAILTSRRTAICGARVYRASATRASDQGPDAGKFDNSPRIARILESCGMRPPKLLALPIPSNGRSPPRWHPMRAKCWLSCATWRAGPSRPRSGTSANCGHLPPRSWASPICSPGDVGFASTSCASRATRSTSNWCAPISRSKRVVAGWQALLTRLFGVTLVERHDVSL